MKQSEVRLGTFSRPTTDVPTRLAVLADLHLSLDRTGTWRVSHRTEAHLESAFECLNSHQLDAVLFVGDLTEKAALEEYDAFDRVLESLEAPFFAIPGNHDLPLTRWSHDSLSLAAFEDRYTPGGLPFRKRIGGIDLLAINSNRATHDEPAESFDGYVDIETLAWLEDELATAAHPLVAVHHNLPGTRELYVEARDRLPVSGASPNLENGDELLDVLASAEAPLVLTGHVHFPAVASKGGVRELTLPPLGPFPNGYTILEIDDRGTTATMHTVSDYWERLEAFNYGIEKDRVLLVAVQLSEVPLIDDFGNRS